MTQDVATSTGTAREDGSSISRPSANKPMQGVAILIGDILLRWRTEARLTQAHLAKELCTSRPAISKMEHARCDNIPLISTILLYAKVCDADALEAFCALDDHLGLDYR